MGNSSAGGVIDQSPKHASIYCGEETRNANPIAWCRNSLTIGL